MSKASGKPKIEVDARDKSIFKNFMTGKTDMLEKGDFKFYLESEEEKPLTKSKK